MDNCILPPIVIFKKSYRILHSEFQFLPQIYYHRNCLLLSYFCNFFHLQDIDEISDPIQAEQYRVIADYKKQQKNEVDLVSGDIVEVFEKNENG